jgi:hypothetical protein
VIICVEMLLLAYLHHLYFNASDFDESTECGAVALGASARGTSFAGGGELGGPKDGDEEGGDDGDAEDGGDGGGAARPPPRPSPPKTMSAREVVRLILPVELVTTDLRLVLDEGVVAPMRRAQGYLRTTTGSPDSSPPEKERGTAKTAR